MIEKGIILVERMKVKMSIDNSRDNGSLSFWVLFATDISLNKLNKWNANKRFLRAYRDNNEVILESDLDVEGGISEDYLLNHLQILFWGAWIFALEIRED